MISIRRAGLHDIDALANIFNEYRVFYHQSPDVEGARKFLSTRIEQEESVVFVATDNDFLGFTQLYPIFSSVGMQKAWLLNDMFVRETARKKGIATQLLDVARDFAKSTEARFLMLQTGFDNLRAQSVYEKHGWKKSTDFLYELSLLS